MNKTPTEEAIDLAMSREYYWYCHTCKRRLKSEERIGLGVRMVCCHCLKPKVAHYCVGAGDEPKASDSLSAEQMRA